VVHGGAPRSLDRVQVLEGDGRLKQLVRNHAECVHVHLAPISVPVSNQ
jgi:hypothetical protein